MKYTVARDVLDDYMFRWNYAWVRDTRLRPYIGKRVLVSKEDDGFHVFEFTAQKKPICIIKIRRSGGAA